MTTRKIELHPAFFFDCDECGREVFLRGDRVHKSVFLQGLSEDEREVTEEMLENLGEDFVAVEPVFVTCPFADCGTTFEVYSPEEETE